MKRLRFYLNSDQLELLLSFENAKGLSHLAQVMAKDQSVVSRNLQRIAEDHPVLMKVKGRWELTPLGIQVNMQTRAFLEDQSKLLLQQLQTSEKKKSKSSRCNANSVLIVINAQKGLFDSAQEHRNNEAAEKNIMLLLDQWRSKNQRVIHVKHVSNDPKSIFFKQSTGCDFLKLAEPINNEIVIEKEKSSAFANTKLEEILNRYPCTDIVLIGFTANECIDASARDAAALGFNTKVVSDATATFDLRDSTGKLVKAERIHKLTLLNINAFYAKVVSSDELLDRSES